MSAEQMSFTDLPETQDLTARALRATTFVVVDLETTGGSAGNDRITEIGAVKIRAGEVLGEFHTLVDPGRSVPPQIVALTGITTAMVYDAPRIEEVLPSFVEFATGSLLVAHNARFDMGFLRQSAARMQLPWPFTTSLCTVRLARRVLSKQEAPSVRLSALADLFNVSVRPTHRALDDARATVDVFHHLLERIGNQGVHTVGDLTAYLPRATPAVRAKRSLADDLPGRPGVYLFRGPGDEVLYIGTAVDLRRRVAGYFNGSDPRTRIAEMVALSIRVDHVECAHALEAGVAELRLLGVHKPVYNRRSRNPQRGWWISLTSERFPRLAVSRTPGEISVGPLPGRAAAADVADVITGLAGLRTCTTDLRKAAHHPCVDDTGHHTRQRPLPDPLVTAVPGICGAAGSIPQTPDDYAPRAEAARDLMTGRSDALLHGLSDRLARLVDDRRFESAARARDRLAAMVEVLSRTQRLAALARVSEVVIARPDGAGGWEFAIVRHGRLAGAACAVRGVSPLLVIDQLRAASTTILPPSDATGPLCGAPAEETALIERWIFQPGSRLVDTTDDLSSPVGSAARHGEFVRRARAARDAVAAPPGQRLESTS